MTVENLLAHRHIDVPTSSGNSERTKAKDFVGVYQAADNWCWAAAAASVVTYYDTKRKSDGPVHPQCLVVEKLDANASKVSAVPIRDLICATFRDGVSSAAGLRCRCQHTENDKEGFLHRALAEYDMLAGWVSLRSGRRRILRRKHTTVPRPANPFLPDRSEADLALLDSSMDIAELDKLLQAGHLVCLRSRRGRARHFIIVYGCETYPDNSLLIWDPAHGTDVVEADRFMQEHGPFTHKIITRAPQVAP